jgi:hypothetical protein
MVCRLKIEDSRLKIEDSRFNIQGLKIKDPGDPVLALKSQDR